MPKGQKGFQKGNMFGRRFQKGQPGRKGADHPNWKGGREITKDGYVKVFARSHPPAHEGKVFEHILIMECHIGRKLYPWESIHHINKDKTYNIITNLVLTNYTVHPIIHKGDRLTGVRPPCPRCGNTEPRKDGYNRGKQQLNCPNYRKGFVESGKFLRNSHDQKCPRCVGNTKKHGGIRNGKQRYLCKECKRGFSIPVNGLAIGLMKG